MNWKEYLIENFFGYEITKKPKKEPELKEISSPEDDGSFNVMRNGVSSFAYNFDPQVNSRNDLIQIYRNMATNPEIDSAISDIINEMVITDLNERPVEIDLDGLDDNKFKTTKQKTFEEFDEVIYNLLNFSRHGHDLVKQWYIDGELFVDKMIDENKPKEGLQKLKVIDSLNMAKIREYQTKPEGPTGVEIVDKVEEYFVYDPSGADPVDHASATSSQIKIKPSRIAYINSGLFSPKRKFVISHLHKAIKPLNLLRVIEDAIVIYRVSRAPERRIFYIDVGNMPTNKAEEYLEKVKNKYKNRIVYDAATGEVKNDRAFTTIMEDYWLPRREGNRGTEIDTLAGGQNLSEIDDLGYFLKKLYKSLNVPYSRVLDQETTFSLGRSNEITRDEVKFYKFIIRLRSRFSVLFDDLLKTQLLLKGILNSEDEWEEIRKHIRYEWASDSQFNELKRFEILNERANLLRELNEYEGKYFSRNWIRRNVLKQTDEEIKEIDKEMEEEKKKFGEPEDDVPGF